MDLKSHARCNGKIAVSGFCFDGLLAFLGAARLEIDAAISFHGSHVGKHLDEAANMSKVEGPSGYCPFWPRARI
jgi:carboxymethylenebutenolidase